MTLIYMFIKQLAAIHDLKITNALINKYPFKLMQDNGVLHLPLKL